jgi:4-amino-4-deoxy-L-arabinose transferase-like glycosyltransferase
VTGRSVAALAAIVALAAVVRLWGLGFGLPYTQARPDETFVIGVALSFLRGNFFPSFYDYPWLYMWILTGAYLAYFAWGLATGAFHSIADLVASWPVHWEPFFLLSRGLSAAFGTATIVVVFAIGRRLWDDTTGLMAAFFLSLAFVHVRDSHFGTTDIAMTFWVMVSVALIVKGHLGNRSSFTGAGIAGGLATATKYTAAVLAAPIVASQVVRLLEAQGARLRAIDGRLLRFGLGFVVALSVGIPFVFLDTPRFLQAMELLRRSTTAGQGLVPTEPGWLHHLRLSLRYGVGLPLLAAGLVGTIAIVVRTPGIAAVLFAFPVAYFAVAASVRNLFFRYAIPIVPFLCLAAAWFVCRTVARFMPIEYQRSRAATAWLIAITIVLPSATSVVEFDHVIAQTDNRVLVARWVEEHVPAGSSVLQSGSQYGLAQLDPRLNYVVWVWDKPHLRFTVDNKVATGRPDWILLQESPLPSETQPIVKAFLQDGYVRVQDFVALSLFGEHSYDQQDAFFVPFAGFQGVNRPGPNFVVYRRIGAASR